MIVFKSSFSLTGLYAINFSIAVSQYDTVVLRSASDVSGNVYWATEMCVQNRMCKPRYLNSLCAEWITLRTLFEYTQTYKGILIDN